MPRLDDVARRRLARTLVSLEGVIGEAEAQCAEDVEPKLKRLKHLRDDIRIVLDFARADAERRLPKG